MSDKISGEVYSLKPGGDEFILVSSMFPGEEFFLNNFGCGKLFNSFFGKSFAVSEPRSERIFKRVSSLLTMHSMFDVQSFCANNCNEKTGKLKIIPTSKLIKNDMNVLFFNLSMQIYISCILISSL